ncbi:peptide ABC transporter [Shewanella sp. NFH-SH190041]|uniref:ATP-binding cassette domain-containing protein n=1 Tax=Shewanella sp. NFH-SH190041 TaxID=2950245 RepID=UPI0021C3D389|nr:ATP-binding cassette domain-containing protein [Shewanella sp. NFH-SH190041]BDM64095.1 peptide ABC transporter [Shewanella sp. NFH-SH190041]
MLSLTGGMIAHQRQIICSDLTLFPGERVGLAGPSGVGKSSLARILAGMDKPYQGQLVLPPVSVGQANPVQWVIQQPEYAFNPRLTLAQSLDEAWQGEDYTVWFKALDIDPQWLLRRPGALSGGQLQRLNLLRALLPTTEYLICDEMTAHLDMLTQQKIWQALLEIARNRQLGLLIISHDEHLLSRVCQRIVHWPIV